MKVVTNVPAIQLEEVSNYVTDRRTVGTAASSELFSKRDIETKTRDELTKDEKSTSHKKWKRNVRTHLKAKEKTKKLKEFASAADSKFEAKMLMKQDKDKKAKTNMKNSELKSSKFFGNLQGIVGKDVDKKSNKKNELLDAGVSTKNIKKIKL